VAVVDIVVVSYNSSKTLKGCVGPLAENGSVNVIVVDNASDDASVESVACLPLTVLCLENNYGFAYGCNRGWETGSAQFVLFLNPDARIDTDSILALASALRNDPALGLVAPRLYADDGALEYSQRRFPRLRSTYAQAFFAHRFFPRAAWVDESVRDPRAYELSGDVEWISGACVLVRREALERIGGWDEGFFLYGEDIDLCQRLWAAGFRVSYDASVTAVHIGGASAPRGRSIPLLTRGRIRFVKKHRNRVIALLHQLGIALGALTHAVFTQQGPGARAGQLRAFRAALFYKPFVH
jgi:GT2 family glycosyltransferase